MEANGDVHVRGRGGAAVLLAVRTRSEVAERRGEHLSINDLRHADLDNSSRLPAAPSMSELTIGGEHPWGCDPGSVHGGGWATLPGSDPANTAVAQACANLLTSLK